MKKIGLMLFLIAIGFVIVALPDADERLFSISRDHGPSLLDAIGLVILLIGHAGLVMEAWKHREKVFQYKHSVYFRTGLFLLGAGLVLVLVSVLNDGGHWWILGVALLVFVQAVFFYIALK